MKLKEIWTVADFRINLGSYEGIAPVFGIKADLEEGDDPDACLSELQGIVAKKWARECIKLIRLYRSWRKDKSAFDELTKPILAELKKQIRK